MSTFAGDPINCLADPGISPHVINTFCWITYTFSLPENYGKEVGTHVAHPGLGNDLSGKRYHSYYQWVPFMLFLQGVLFYVPHWMWKQWEEGKIRMISEGLRGAMVDTKQERQSKVDRLVQYLIETMHLHNSYAAGYFFCEALNFVNVVSVTFFVIELCLPLKHPIDRGNDKSFTPVPSKHDYTRNPCSVEYCYLHIKDCELEY